MQKDYERKLDEQKITLKKRINELEVKIKDFEDKNKTINMEMIKKEARWQNEEQNLITKIEDYKESCR